MAEPSAAGASSPAPNYTEQMLGDVHARIVVDRAILAVARQRRNAITAAARRFRGALRVFFSGSVAHGTVIFEVEDADGGVVLDRRSYPELGSDARGVGPTDIVAEMAAFIYNELRANFPGLRYEVPGKRSIKFTFNDPVKGQDPVRRRAWAAPRAARQSRRPRPIHPPRARSSCMTAVLAARGWVRTPAW